MRKHFITMAIGFAVMALSVSAADPIGETFHVNVDDLTIFTDRNPPYNEIKTGGFSGIYPVPNEPGKFYVVSDVGPAPSLIHVMIVDGEEVEVGEWKLRPLPDFGPRLMIVDLYPEDSDMAEIVDIRPLWRPADVDKCAKKKLSKKKSKKKSKKCSPVDGWVKVTGQPNSSPSKLYDVMLNDVPSDVDGLDAEGVTMDDLGNLWIADEGKPSVAMLTPRGQVLLRLVPEGTLLGGETIPTYDILPGILAKRVNNKALEGIAYAGNGILYTTMQRPLANPDKDTSEASKMIRLLAIDLNMVFSGKGKKAVSQFIFVADLVHPKDYASDIFALDETTLLVGERKADKLYAIDVLGATEISKYEDKKGRLKGKYRKMVKDMVAADGNPPTTIEMLDEDGLAAVGIIPVAKEVILDSLTDIDDSLSKCEGVCMVGNNIVLTADNDFNIDDTVVEVESEDDPVIVPIPITLQDPVNLPKIFVVPWPNLTD